MWSASEHDGVLQRLSDLGDSGDGTPEQREMWELAEKWKREGGVPAGGCASIDDETLLRALIILQTVAWLEWKERQR
jgi:hypothetical protein